MRDNPREAPPAREAVPSLGVQGFIEGWLHKCGVPTWLTLTSLVLSPSRGYRYCMAPPYKGHIAPMNCLLCPRPQVNKVTLTRQDIPRAWRWPARSQTFLWNVQGVDSRACWLNPLRHSLQDNLSVLFLFSENLLLVWFVSFTVQVFWGEGEGGGFGRIDF